MPTLFIFEEKKKTLKIRVNFHSQTDCISSPTIDVNLDVSSSMMIECSRNCNIQGISIQ